MYVTRIPVLPSYTAKICAVASTTLLPMTAELIALLTKRFAGANISLQYCCGSDFRQRPLALGCGSLRSGRLGNNKAEIATLKI